MDLRYLSGRYTCPFFVGLALSSIAGGAVGFGLAYWLAWFDGRGTTLIGICGFAAAVAATLLYRRAAESRRVAILHGLTSLYFGFFGLFFGGAPGALIGQAVGGDFGRMIGWFATAPLAVVVAVIWGWRYSHRIDLQVDRRPVATDDHR